jgi:DtxR family Mn-dependent transcriptional regulator
MKKSNEITATMQDYLEMILIISEFSDEIRITDISQRLNISKSSVAQGIDHLKRHGLVYQPKYGPIYLTDKGREIATDVKWRHDKLKKFLIEVLGCEDRIAEQDACRMEHVISQQTMLRLLGYMEAVTQFKNNRSEKSVRPLAGSPHRELIGINSARD